MNSYHLYEWLLTYGGPEHCRLNDQLSRDPGIANFATLKSLDSVYHFLRQIQKKMVAHEFSPRIEMTRDQK